MILLDFVPFRRCAGRVAVIEESPYRSRKVTYSALEEGMFNAAASLRELNIGEGDRVVLWGENSARWMMTFYACLALRVVVVPIDASYSMDFVRKVQRVTQAKFVFSDEDGSTWNHLVEGSGYFDLAGPAPPLDSLAEIIFTSGTTGDPKGVMITHGNLLANLTPIHDEYQKYKGFAVPFSPLGFCHVIPLSHLFGQVMGLFIPQMVGGTVIFCRPAAQQIIEAVKANRASVVVCVPQELSLLRKRINAAITSAVRVSVPAAFPSTNHLAGGDARPSALSTLRTIATRWWKHRQIHRQFGWKFWAFVVGGASLPQADETFWSDLGFAVIQGYGLTETAPSITITHPFKGIKHGYVGKKLPGMDVKIAPDGEILVRGPQVSPGYFQNESATSEVFEDGWLRTGDLGRFDEEGNLQLLGRKKEVIVTSEGLNVYPEDVERALNQDSRVVESAVVARVIEAESSVHAVLVLAEAGNQSVADGIMHKANEHLEGFQRISSCSVWPDSHLPRTSTGKLKRLAIASAVAGQPIPSSKQAEESDLAERLLSGVKNPEQMDQPILLSSLDRVELLMNLEEARGTSIDETAFASAKTVGDVARLLDSPVETKQNYPYWKWPQWLPVRLLRYLLWYTIAFPAMPLRMKVRATGVENLKDLNPPCFFVANHQSILDAPAILKALPTFRWKRSLAPAMGARRHALDLYAAALFFNIYPLPDTSIGLRKALQLTGELVDAGYSPLVFPEGERTPDGKLRPFRPGIGVMVRQTKLPVIPIFVEGAYKIWPIHARGPAHKGTIDVHFGKPVDFSGKQPVQITTELEELYKSNQG